MPVLLKGTLLTILDADSPDWSKLVSILDLLGSVSNQYAAATRWSLEWKSADLFASA